MSQECGSATSVSPEPLENESEPDKGGTGGKPWKATPDLEELDLATAGTGTWDPPVSPPVSPGAIPTLCHPRGDLGSDQSDIPTPCPSHPLLRGNAHLVSPPRGHWW